MFLEMNRLPDGIEYCYSGIACLLLFFAGLSEDSHCAPQTGQPVDSTEL
jgi:hypothetical protein